MSFHESFTTTKNGIIIYTGTNQIKDEVDYNPATLQLFSVSEWTINKRANNIIKITGVKQKVAFDYIAHELGYNNWDEIRKIRPKNFKAINATKHVESVYDLIPTTSSMLILNEVSQFVEKMISQLNADPTKKELYKKQTRRLTSQLNRMIHLMTNDNPKKYSKQRCECGRFLTWKELKYCKNNLIIIKGKKVCQKCMTFKNFYFK